MEIKLKFFVGYNDFDQPTITFVNQDWDTFSISNNDDAIAFFKNYK